jgi:endogenous inhibitor of DNA gyrase (YacG/DUF329 family)
MTNPHLCPICRRALGEDAQEARFRPFCSKRCADVDLGRWLKGAYAIPAVENDEMSEDGTGESEGQDGDGAGPPVRH